MLKRGWSCLMGFFLQNNFKNSTEWIILHGVKLPIIAHKMFNNYKWQSSNKWKLIYWEINTYRIMYLGWWTSFKTKQL